jgi:hypothetical protein
MTSPTQWIAAALKILAIYLLVRATTSLPSYAGVFVGEFFSPSDDPIARAARWSTIGGFVGLLLTVGIAGVLWRRSGALAAQIWSDAQPPIAAKGDLTADRLQLIAFGVFGLYLLINAAPDLLEQALAYRAIRDVPADFSVDPERSTRLVVSFAITVVKITLGLWLLLYPEGLGGLIRRLRGAITGR